MEQPEYRENEQEEGQEALRYRCGRCAAAVKNERIQRNEYRKIT